MPDLKVALSLALSVAMSLVGCASSPPAEQPSTIQVEASRPSPSSSAPAAGSIPAVPYDLPRAGEFLPEPNPAAPTFPRAVVTQQVPVILAIELTQTGRISVDGRSVPSDEEVTRIAREALAANPDVRAVIKADRNATWASVVHVMDLVRLAGITKIAFAVEPVPPSSPP